MFRTGAPGAAQVPAAGPQAPPTTPGVGATTSIQAEDHTAAGESPIAPPSPATSASVRAISAAPPYINTLLREEESSADSEDSEDDDSESEDGRDIDMFSGAVSAVSTLLASFNRGTQGSTASAASTAESMPRQDDNESIDTAATTSSLSVAVGTPRETRTDSPIRQSRRRVESSDLVANGRYSDLSAKERSTAHVSLCCYVAVFFSNILFRFRTWSRSIDLVSGKEEIRDRCLDC